MKADARKLLSDVADSCAALRTWRGGRTIEDFLADRQFRRAVERELEIVGEALNQLSIADPEVAVRISDLRRIVGLRNRLAHGYASIDTSILWAVLEAPLARLSDEMGRILAEQEPLAPGGSAPR